MQSFFLFLKVFKIRFIENRLTMAAGYLTYSTMLAIVPLIMVVFSIVAAFPAFDEVTSVLKQFIYENFAPSSSVVIQQHLESFINNSSKMSSVGIIGLIVVALMLIFSVDNVLNIMWHKTKKRRPIVSFAIYWMILTLSPLLAGLSIAISSYIFSLEVFQPNGVFGFSYKLLKLAPFFITWLLFSIIYTIVPNTQVLFRHASVGAFIAALFFTIGKKIFVWGITSFSSYQAIYGALAVLPIMIVWIHLSWLVVLIGAQISAAFKDMMLIRIGTLSLSADNKELV